MALLLRPSMLALFLLASAAVAMFPLASARPVVHVVTPQQQQGPVLVQPAFAGPGAAAVAYPSTFPSSGSGGVTVNSPVAVNTPVTQRNVEINSGGGVGGLFGGGAPLLG